MVLVDYHCPHCHSISRAPLRNIAEGPIGYWCCEACDGAFRVRVNLDSIELVRPPVARPRKPGLPAPEKQPVEQQLLELRGEQSHLRSRLHEVDEAVSALQPKEPL